MSSFAKQAHKEFLDYAEVAHNRKQELNAAKYAANLKDIERTGQYDIREELLKLEKDPRVKASANFSQSQADTYNALKPGAVEGQDITNQKSAFDLSLAKDKKPFELDKLAIANRGAIAINEGNRITNSKERLNLDFSEKAHQKVLDTFLKKNEITNVNQENELEAAKRLGYQDTRTYKKLRQQQMDEDISAATSALRTPIEAADDETSSNSEPGSGVPYLGILPMKASNKLMGQGLQDLYHWTGLKGIVNELMAPDNSLKKYKQGK